MKKTFIAQSLGFFSNQKNSDLLNTGDLNGFFKNRHSSHICFIDGEDGGSDGGADNQGADGDQGSDQSQFKQDTLLGDEGEGGEGGDDDKGDGKNDGDDDKSDKNTDEGDQDKDKDEETGAPEKYEISLPEGMELDEKALEKFEPLFREMDMSNEQASKLAEAFGEHVGSLLENTQASIIESMQNQWTEVNKGWKDAIMSDEEYGGAKVQENLNVARSVIERFGGDKEEIGKIRDALNETGAGNNPEVMRLLYRVGKAMQDDKLHGGANDAGGKGQKDFFPNSPDLK